MQDEEPRTSSRAPEPSYPRGGKAINDRFII